MGFLSYLPCRFSPGGTCKLFVSVSKRLDTAHRGTWNLILHCLIWPHPPCLGGKRTLLPGSFAGLFHCLCTARNDIKRQQNQACCNFLLHMLSVPLPISPIFVKSSLPCKGSGAQGSRVCWVSGCKPQWSELHPVPRSVVGIFF